MCCEVIIRAKFGHLEPYYLGQVNVIIWAKFVFSLFLSWFQAIFCTFSYHFVFFCWEATIRQLFKITIKLGARCFVFKIPFFELNLEFLTLRKHYKNRDSATFCVFCCSKRRKGQNNDNWNFWFWVFWSKNGHFVTVKCFLFFGLLKPLFL